MAQQDGWSGLFATAFERSRNAMLLTDGQRVIVDTNPAFLGLLGRRRDAVIGEPVYAFVAGGPLATNEEWAVTLAEGRFSGETELVDADGRPVVVQWAASTEIVTGRSLVLFVALSISRWGSRTRRTVDPDEPPRALTPREREIVHHLALGAAGPEIADELQISHETVRTHVRNAMGKVGARSRAHLVAKSLGHGLTFV
jgi:PAS domain S-box-containing protein